MSLSPVFAKTSRHQYLTGSHRHKKIVCKKKPTAEEIEAAKAAKERESEEARFNQSRNSIITRAYQLYNSGTNEALLGNYKYSLLQLKLCNELLNEHDEGNSALSIAALTALAGSAKSAGEYKLAISAYEKLLLMNPQDKQSWIDLARLQADNGNFQGARISLNKVLNVDADNPEGLLFLNLMANQRQSAK